MFAFLSVLLYLWDLQTLSTLVKKKAMCNYIDLTVEAYEEYFETPFSGWGSPIFIVVQQKERQTKIR